MNDRINSTMANVAEHLLILESLFLIPEKIYDIDRISNNVDILRSNANLTTKLDSSIPVEDMNDPEWAYTFIMHQIVLAVIDEVDFNSELKEDLLSAKHINLLISSIQDLSVYGLRNHLHPVFRSHKIFDIPTKAEPNLLHLQYSLDMFHKILAIRQFQSGGALNEVIRDYIAGIFTIIECDLTNELNLSEEEKKLYQRRLNSIWEQSSKCEYFRNILLFKGLPNIPPALQKRLHIELLNKLMSKGGFTNFVTTLLTKRTTADLPESEYFEVIANIVAHKGHSIKFYNCLVEQIFEFLNICIEDQNLAVCMGAGLLTLKMLYELKSETRLAIVGQVDLLFQKLTQPEDVIAGLIVMEPSEFTCLCNFLFTCFCTSSMECLPSEILTRYLPLLITIYSYIPDKYGEKIHVRGAIIRCLANRNRPELDKIVSSLVCKQYPDTWLNLHPRVSIRSDEHISNLTVKITSPDAQPDAISISNVLPELLLSSNHNILKYIVFMSLLSMMEEELYTLDDSYFEQYDSMRTKKELYAFLNRRYPVKVEIILCLTTLVTDPSLKSQISENSSEFLDFLKTFLKRRRGLNSACSQESTTLLLMLTIIQEIIESSEIPEQYRDFIEDLEELRKYKPNIVVIHKTDQLIRLLERGLKAKQDSTSQYNRARDLMKENESHLKVYGINLMIEMLRRKERDALANRHITLALGLHALKEIESYTFLNCVRLLIELVNVMEEEVLETLCDEYLNKNNTMDYRLVVGEAILKVSKELSQLAYKYKDVLLNCFINGSRSEIDEFRWSSFSNLATLCRTLTFQVHSFFQEMLLLIENEVQNGKYLPAKRAAVLVLSELLLGIDNLLDHEEYLLPIYRVLKTLSTDSEDEKIRAHATSGLIAIAGKCKKFLFPDEKQEKEIKIIGIKDPLTKKSSGHILELN